MSFRQVYYTSCRTGLRGSPGFQVNAATPGIAANVLQQVERLAVYVPPVSAPSRPGPQQLAEFPLALIYQRFADGTVVLAQARYVGPDYSGRFGNYFAHSLVSTAPDPDLGDLLPIQLWRSPLWQTTESATTELPEAGPLLPGKALDLPQVAAFLAEKDRLSHLAAFVTAVEQALRTRRRVVIVDSSDAVAHWLAAMSFLLPRSLLLQLTFNTYVKSPYQSDALVVGTTPDSDFGFAPHEIQHTVFLFDFVGSRFTPIAEPSPLGQLAAEVFRAGKLAHLAGYGAFVTGVAPQLLLDEAAVAFACYFSLIGMTAPGIDAAQLAQFCAPRLARFPLSQVGPLYTQLLAGPVTAQTVEAAVSMMGATLAPDVLPAAQATAAAVVVGWMLGAPLRTVATESLAQLIAALSQMAEIKRAARLHPLDWSALLDSTREAHRLLLYVLLGTHLGCIDDCDGLVAKLGEEVVGPALSAEPVQKLVAQLAGSRRALLDGIAAYLLPHENEPQTFVDLRPLLASAEVAGGLQEWALAKQALLLYFHLTTAHASREPPGRRAAFQQCMEGVARLGAALTGPLLLSAVAAVWGNEQPSYQAALLILSAGPPAVLAQTPIPEQLAQRLGQATADPIHAHQKELGARLNDPVLRAALGSKSQYLDLFAAAVHLGQADWESHWVSALTCANRAGPYLGDGVCRVAARKLTEQLSFPLHQTLLQSACTACPWFGPEYLAAMRSRAEEERKLSPQTVVSLLACWLELELAPEQEATAAILLEQVLPVAVRSWDGKERAAALAAAHGQGKVARRHLSRALAARGQLLKILLLVLTGVLCTAVTLVILWLRYGRHGALPWPAAEPFLQKVLPASHHG